VHRLIQWEREFQVWHYTVSYSQLLLRSLGHDDRDTRVDILFSNVYLMHLRPAFAQLRIDLADDDWTRDAVALPRGVPAKWYVLNEDEGYVLATDCQWHEDRGDHHSPSKFGPLRGVE
jgi:hypothetical protein